MDWKHQAITARHWAQLDGTGHTQCQLCPRRCVLAPSQSGFCGVRGNIDGRLHSFNYARSVPAAVETIETEAVYHYRPGARILSLGNIGCMLSCCFCQNWETSQVRHLKPHSVVSYAPERVVELARDRGIEILSWTYNDPVVWHEYVVETARLARAKGVRSLYKSALHIEKTPLDELIGLIDVFSISLKSLSEDFYEKYTKGRLQPVLEAIDYLHRSGCHLEISQLLIPVLNDRMEDVQRTVDWVLDHLGPKVPLHFVRFHPAYRYAGVSRTFRQVLLRARQIALEAGVQYCYIGNLFEEGVADTHCHSCKNRLIRRFGLSVALDGIQRDGTCTRCGADSPIIEPFAARGATHTNSVSFTGKRQAIDWSTENNIAHVVLVGSDGCSSTIRVEHKPSGVTEYHELSGEMPRVVISRMAQNDERVEIQCTGAQDVRILPLLDRAHYPPLSVERDARS